MLRVLKTGAPWRDLPERFGPWKAAFDRFAAGPPKGSGAGPWTPSISRSRRSTSRWSASTAVPSGRADEPSDHALGRRRGGWGTKVHLVCDRKGKPVAATLGAGQAHEARLFEAATGLALAKGRPEAVASDKGCSSGEVRTRIAAAGALDVVPTQGDEARNGGFDREIHRERNVVERRRVATRREKLALHDLAMVKIAMIRRLL